MSHPPGQYSLKIITSPKECLPALFQNALPFYTDLQLIIFNYLFENPVSIYRKKYQFYCKLCFINGKLAVGIFLQPNLSEPILVSSFAIADYIHCHKIFNHFCKIVYTNDDIDERLFFCETRSIQQKYRYVFSSLDDKTYLISLNPDSRRNIFISVHSFETGRCLSKRPFRECVLIFDNFNKYCQNFSNKSQFQYIDCEKCKKIGWECLNEKISFEDLFRFLPSFYHI